MYYCWINNRGMSMSEPVLKEKYLHGTITNMRDARNSFSAIWEKILHAPLNLRNCFCRTPLCFGCLMSYDHEDGETLPGFQKPQWVYVHCLKCGYDTNIYKIGIHPGEVKELFDESMTCSECASYKNAEQPWCKQDSSKTTPNTTACNLFQYEE